MLHHFNIDENILWYETINKLILSKPLGVTCCSPGLAAFSYNALREFREVEARLDELKKVGLAKDLDDAIAKGYFIRE